MSAARTREFPSARSAASVLVYSGSVNHGGDANRSNARNRVSAAQVAEPGGGAAALQYLDRVAQVVDVAELVRAAQRRELARRWGPPAWRERPRAARSSRPAEEASAGCVRRERGPCR